MERALAVISEESKRIIGMNINSVPQSSSVLGFPNSNTTVSNSTGSMYTSLHWWPPHPKILNDIIMGT
jgi:hypothetical protein